MAAKKMSQEQELKNISKLDTPKYRGQWVVVCNNQIVAHGKNLKKLEKDILSCKTAPLIMKVPQKQVLLY